MNTESKHTPGPWHVSMKPGPIVYGPQGEQVANMHVAMLDQEEHKADAKAIAAVPQLLEALEKCGEYLATIDAMQPDKNHGTIGNAIREGIKSALLAAGYTE